MALAGTFALVANWAKTTIEGVSGAGNVWSYRRKIRTLAQLADDFGYTIDSVLQYNSQNEVITRGWMVDVNSRPLADRQGKSGVWQYQIDYICLWSVENQGANEPDFKLHVETVSDALMSVARPAALAAIDASSNEIVRHVDIGEIYTVVFPLDSGRLHHRADVSQIIQLRQSIRS